MKQYHYVWLEDHPTRNEKWLKERLVDGFHIHHVDGNHANNHPKNLCLIEGMDHYNNIHLNTIDYKQTLREKIAAAKARGVKFGRPEKLNPTQKMKIAERYSSGETLKDLADDYQVAISTIHLVVSGKRPEE